MSSASLGYGSQLQHDASGSFATVAEVVSISGPSMKADAKDVSNMDSPNAFKEFIAGMRDGGELSIEANWIPGHATQSALLNDFNNGTLRNWKIILPAAVGKTWTGTAIITQFAPAVPLDDKIGLSLTLKVSGKPTLA